MLPITNTNTNKHQQKISGVSSTPRAAFLYTRAPRINQKTKDTWPGNMVGAADRKKVPPSTSKLIGKESREYRHNRPLRQHYSPRQIINSQSNIVILNMDDFLWILVSRPQKGPPHARCKFTQPFLAHITSRYRDELWRKARIFWPYMRSWADRTRGSQACTDDKILGCCEGGGKTMHRHSLNKSIKMRGLVILSAAVGLANAAAVEVPNKRHYPVPGQEEYPAVPDTEYTPPAPGNGAYPPPAVEKPSKPANEYPPPKATEPSNGGAYPPPPVNTKPTGEYPPPEHTKPVTPPEETQPTGVYPPPEETTDVY
ncbi:hypothetical protein HZ326_31181, partial [Fusarium oxysporum f. sp. albedinis]